MADPLKKKLWKHGMKEKKGKGNGETAKNKVAFCSNDHDKVVMAIIMIPAFCRSMDDCVKNEEVKQCGIIVNSKRICIRRRCSRVVEIILILVVLISLGSLFPLKSNRTNLVQAILSKNHKTE